MNWIKTDLSTNSRLTKAQLAKNLCCGGKFAESLCQRLMSQTDSADSSDMCGELGNKLDNWVIGPSELIASQSVDWDRRTELWSGELCDPSVALAGLVDEIIDYLREEQGAAVLFENGCARRGDPAVDSFESPYSYVDDRLVHLIRPNSMHGEVRKAILEAFSGSWLVGLFVRSFSGSDDLLSEMLETRELGDRSGGIESLVRNTERVVVSAMDLEAYLISDLTEE